MADDSNDPNYLRLQARLKNLQGLHAEANALTQKAHIIEQAPAAAKARQTVSATEKAATERRRKALMEEAENAQNFAKDVANTAFELHLVLTNRDYKSKDLSKQRKAQKTLEKGIGLLEIWEEDLDQIQSKKGPHVWYHPEPSEKPETLMEQVQTLRDAITWVLEDMNLKLEGGRKRRRTGKRKTRRRHRRKTRRRIGHDEKEMKRLNAQYRRSRIARGDKRFKATKGLVKWSRPSKTRRSHRIYHRRRKKRQRTRKRRRR